MQPLKTIGIVGFGNMGQAYAAALANLTKIKILTYDQKKIRGQSKLNAEIVSNFGELAVKSQMLVLAIKPQDWGDFISQNQSLILQAKPLVISLLAGVPLKVIEKQLPGLKVVRFMPNLGVKIRKSVTAVAFGSKVKQGDIAVIKKVFRVTGILIEIRENLIDDFTALAGSGPGFVFYLMDIFYQRAVEAGFSKNQAKKITVQIFEGSSELAKVSEKSFCRLLDCVASKGGTTEAGINYFKRHKLGEKFERGIDFAAKRAKKISKNNE